MQQRARHPYIQYEGTALWQLIDSELRSLEKNGDLALTTDRVYVIGALCQRLASSGLISMGPSDAHAP